MKQSKLTIVSGIWDLSISGRDFKEHYLPRFEEFLKIPCSMVLFVPKSLESYVWERRSKDDTVVKIYELDDIKDNMFSPFWDKWQKIRTNPDWLAQAGWLAGSPQGSREHYFPIQSCKMFWMHDAKIWNHFDSEYFMWMDAGLTNTVDKELFYKKENLEKITEYVDPFLFLSYPYEADQEIHGFTFKDVNRYAGKKVEYVCRGGLFACHIDFLTEANSQYYSLVERSLSEGLGGAEEVIFTILSYLSPENYRRYAIDGNGLIVKFMHAIDNNNVTLEKIPEDSNKTFKPTVKNIDNIKTNLYFLTFNYPEQLEFTIKSLQKHSGFLTHPRQKVIIDNSTNQTARDANKAICDKYGFSHWPMNSNLGICGGRQKAAEHFNDTDSDFYLFFEDDMTISDPEEGFCRNGFQKYVPDLYKKIHQIMVKEKFDYLKLSYTEVYMDNNIQVSWYNVPQGIRDELWPDYNKLPVNGLDPNCPRTKLKHIEVIDGLSYLSGDIYYANWPQIVSREGNKKMFLNTTWAHPYEQTWMSHIFQESIKGSIQTAVLLASPVTHERFKYYEKHERVEG